MSPIPEADLHPREKFIARTVTWGPGRRSWVNHLPRIALEVAALSALALLGLTLLALR